LDYLHFSKLLTFHQAESRISSNLFTKTQAIQQENKYRVPQTLVSCAAGALNATSVAWWKKYKVSFSHGCAVAQM